MARYRCERCGADCNTLDPPHLCKDVKKRLERRQRQVDEVKAILASHNVPENYWRTIAEEIVTKLAQLGVTDD